MDRNRKKKARLMEIKAEKKKDPRSLNIKKNNDAFCSLKKII